MARKQATKQANTKRVQKIKNIIKPPLLTNGLADALNFHQNPGGFGSTPIFPMLGSREQVENADTIFENLRWYMVSNFRQMLSQAFVEIGLVQTICCVPVDDGLRGGILIKSKQLDEDQIKLLRLTMDRDGDLDVAGWAAKWERLYGGAGIMILIDDQDPEEPFKVDSISKDSNVEFREADMWELFKDRQNIEGFARDEEISEFYSYYNEPIHKSRVLPLKGMKAPSFVRPRLRGWGLSVVEALVRSMNQYLKATDLGFEVLDEFKLDVYKIKNLVNTLLSPNGTSQVRQTVQMMNWQKNYQNAIVMDTEDDFDHKQLSFAGLAEAMEGIRMQIASDMRMPISKLFGQAVVGGLGQSDGNDMENYNSMVESEIRGKLKYHVLRMAEIKCQKLFGFIPDDLDGEFKPLREESPLDQETVKTQKFTRVLQAKQAGELTTLEFRDACNKGNLFDIQLDTDEASLNDPDLGLDEVSDEGEKDPGNESTGEKKVSNRLMMNNEKWEENKHPRADDGRFGKGAGGKSSTGKKAKPVLSSPLSESEKTAIGSYKGIGYAGMNGFLRGNKVRDPEKAEREIAALDSAISKSTLAEDTTLYRGMYNVPDIRALGEAGIGKEISMPTYWSGSTNSETAEGFTMEASSEKGVLFEIKLKAGQKALDTTAGTKETETLLPRGQRYKIIGFKENKPPTYVLEVVEETKTQNEFLTYSDWDNMKRFFNSPAFDRASYEADGGDNWIAAGRKELFENPGNVDEALWSKAEAASQAAFGEKRWQFVTWWYKKQGGKFT